MIPRPSHERRYRGDDYQQDEAELYARFGHPARDAEHDSGRHDVPLDPGMDYRQWRRDRYKRLSERVHAPRAAPAASDKSK